MNLALLEPWVVLLAFLIAPLMAWHILFRIQQEGRVRFSTLNAVARLPATPRLALLPLLDVLRVFTLLAIIVALARPAVVRSVEATPEAGIDVVLALDISGSMAAKDLGPKSRLETAKDVIQEFLAARNGDRIGLVAFAAEAVTVSPLTLDYTTLLGLLGEMTFDRLPQGTALGNGLAESVNLVREGSGKSRVVIILTDGRSTTGDVSPEMATQVARTLGVRTYTIGVGAAGDGAFGRVNFRDTIDEDGMRGIADSTGGAYFRATDQTTLSQVYATIDQMEKTETGVLRTVEVQDVGYVALLVAGLLLLLELLLRNTLFRRTA